MRVPLQESGPENTSGIEISSSSNPTDDSLRWYINDLQPDPDERVIYIYTAHINDKKKFYEDGRIYNADGSVADNELLSKTFYFYGFSHASLNKMMKQPVARFHSNYLYGLSVGNDINLKRIASVRDRLNVPDWVALLVFTKIIDEGAIHAILGNTPDLFEAYPVEWVIRLLSIKPDEINMFGPIDDDGIKHMDSRRTKSQFDIFCKIIELEKQHVSSALRIGEM